ncbi:MAG TPA: ABC transporter ATP-binding protein [Candidatus Dojkabacteria bacterium]|nr:ABC transporter ATP-binding protein [Candidatus Dojkabacteria bacterium]HPP18561.1 ABC transporter ATP-binding protein [Candidatus Dojkabacteria bacterium]
MSYIQVQNLKRRYAISKSVSVDALRGVTFDVEKGEFISVIGSSGSGKSTLLNILGGLDRKYTGSVYVDEKDIKEYDPNYYRRYIVGTIFQQFYLIPSLNVEENILLPLKFGKKEGIDFEERLNYLLDIVGLKHRVKHFPRELSGGEAQRVAIARALIDSPKIVLADEPTGNLDSKTGNDILELLKELNKEEELTILLVTHDQAIAQKTDRIITLVDGKNV